MGNIVTKQPDGIIHIISLDAFKGMKPVPYNKTDTVGIFKKRISIIYPCYKKIELIDVVSQGSIISNNTSMNNPIFHEQKVLIVYRGPSVKM
jgi:hypothetical protein